MVIPVSQVNFIFPLWFRNCSKSAPKSSETSTQGLGKEMIVGVIAALAVAGAIGIILGLISRASKGKD